MFVNITSAFYRPAIQSVEEIIKLIDLGTNLIRFNQSYGNVKSNSKLFKMFFEAKKLRPHKNVAVMLELLAEKCVLVTSSSQMEVKTTKLR